MIIHTADLTIDPEIQLQTRGIEQETVQAYVVAMANDSKFPPVIAFREDGHLWLADGFHRAQAATFLGLAEIDADVREGTRTDAILYAAIANVKSGKQMNMAQKREGAERYFEHASLSNPALARKFAVAESTIRNWRKSLEPPLSSQICEDKKVRTVTRNGTTYEMDTSQIGMRKEKPELAKRFEQVARANLSLGLDPFGVPLRALTSQAVEDGEEEKNCTNCAHAIDYHDPMYVFCSFHGMIFGLADFPPDCKWEEEKELQAGASQAVEVTMFSHGSVEYYTPPRYIDAAREVLGGIDLDPATCEAAQEWIRATDFYTKDDDGLSKPWFGKVWLNPPYSKEEGKSNQARWSQRLVQEYKSGHVEEAILLVKAALGYKWFEGLWVDWPACFARERLSFIKNDGSDDGQSKQATAFFYLGPDVEKFKRVFKQFGRVIMPEQKE